MYKRVLRLLSVSVLICVAGVQNTYAEPDPDFHIFLCIGQSNMVGQGMIEAQDKVVPERFLMMSPVGCDNHPKQQWSVAVPPLCRCDTKLGPVDYFGRTLLTYLPDSARVGVIVVGVDGTAIDLFHPKKYKAYIDKVNSTISLNYQVAQINAYYHSNPLEALLTCARLAQQDGVIKGVLLHQGETDAQDGNLYWRKDVKEVYENILNELGLSADSVPLLAGEAVRGDSKRKGQCAGANRSIGKLPQVIPTAHIVSSEGCPCQSDYLHFNSAGYRMLGQRYAEVYLTECLGVDITKVTPHSSGKLSDGYIYNTSGERLETLQHGAINIINGKKYWIE